MASFRAETIHVGNSGITAALSQQEYSLTICCRVTANKFIPEDSVGNSYCDIHITEEQALILLAQIEQVLELNKRNQG